MGDRGYQSPGIGYSEKEIISNPISIDTLSVGVVGASNKGPTDLTLITTKAQLYETFGYPVSGDYGLYAAEEILPGKVYFKRAYHSTAALGYAGASSTHGNSVTSIAVADDAALAVSTTSEDNKTIVFTVDGVEKTYIIDKDIVKKSVFLNAISSVLFGLATVEFDSANKLKVTSKSTGIGSTVVIAGTATALVGTPVATPGAFSEDPFIFKTKTFDSTLNNCIVALTVDTAGVVGVSITDENGEIFESLSGFSLVSSNPLYIGTAFNEHSDYLDIEVTGAPVPEGYVGATLTVRDGNDGVTGLSAADVIVALKDFYDSDKVDISSLIVPGWSDAAIISEVYTLCNARGDLQYIPDPPVGLTMAQAVDWSNAEGHFIGGQKLDCQFFSFYAPWYYKTDVHTKKKILLPPSCKVAAQFNFNDKAAHPWYAPAGISEGRGVLSGVEGLEYNATKGERDLAYGGSNVVNPIMWMPSYGYVLFGNKTTLRPPKLGEESAFSRTNIRRMCNYIKKIVIDISLTELFNPNDRYTWNSWKLKIEPRLREIKDGRGIEAFKIIMDESTVTDADIAAGRMPGIIYVKPTRAVEYIPITFYVTSESVYFKE